MFHPKIYYNHVLVRYQRDLVGVEKLLHHICILDLFNLYKKYNFSMLILCRNIK